MPVSIVVGGQFGSEGKGKVAHFLAREMGASFAVRCGGPNSGHTVIDQAGNARIFKQLPTAAILPDIKLAICSGSYIDLDILLKVIWETGVDERRLVIDPDAIIITSEIKEQEILSGLITKIGSTGSGTGAAVAARIGRQSSLRFACDCKELTTFIQVVPDILREALAKQERIIIEGTQGVGLSLLHSRHYPFTTSRDTTAAAFLSETGLSPFDVDDIVLTIRTFPIRVAGESGPLPLEIDWETVTLESGQGKFIQEKTSVTNQIRRVGRFSSDVVQRGILLNQPTRIALNHLDYLSADIKNNKERIVCYIKNIESQIKKPIDLLGNGPATTFYAKEL